MTSASSPQASPIVWLLLLVVSVGVAIFSFTYIPAGPGPGPDLDCRDIGHQVRISGSDPHRLDADHDGIGCERDGKKYGWLGMLALLGGAFSGWMLYQVFRQREMVNR